MTIVYRTLMAAVLAPVGGALLFLCVALPFNIATHEADLAAVRDGLRAADARRAFLADPRSAVLGVPFDPVRGSDQFTDCIVLLQVLYRHEDRLKDAVDSRMGEFTPVPCERVMQAVDGAVSPPGSYFRYWMGSRYLLQAFLPAMTVEEVRNLYKTLSYGAVAVLVLAAFRVSRPVGLAVLPVGAALIVGLGLDVFGQHLGHAPTYFVPMALAALMCAVSGWFVDVGRRLVAVAVIAASVAYFDILSGGLPFMLALMLFITHLCYGSTLSPHGSARAGNPILSFAAVGAVFTATAILVVVAKLAAMATIAGMHDPFSAFLASLSDRMGTTVLDFTVTRAMVFEKLWEFRVFAFSGSPLRADLVLAAGAAAWGLAIAAAPLCRSRRTVALDVLLLLAAAATVPAWYMAFVNHTFIHTWFMVRVGTLPVAIGFSALVVVAVAMVRQRRAAAALGWVGEPAWRG